MEMQRNEDEDEDDCRYSCILILSALAQFVLHSIAVYYTIQSLQDGLFNEFDVEEALMIIFFQIFSLSFGAYALINITEKAWKGLFGNGELFSTKLRSIFAGVFGLVFLIISALYFIYRQDTFQFHGIYFLLDGLTCLIYSIIFIRRFQLINDFVHDLLHANTMHFIPINEQNARDLYKLQEYEQEKRVYINSTRYGPFYRHVRAFRHSEYYQLQKWIAQIERFVYSPEPKDSIMALVREMNERTRVLKVNAEDQDHYKQLATLPFILMPTTPIKHQTIEYKYKYEDEV